MIKRIAPILIPIVALVAWCVSLQSTVSFGRVVRLAIEGYDPRDLLSGHYLRFTLSFARDLSCPESNPEYDGALPMCACLATSKSDPRYFEGAEILDCERAKVRCPVFLQGECSGNRFRSDLTRYYIAEEFGSVLATVPSDASALVAIDRDGAGVIKGLLVGDEEIEEYARKRLIATPTPTLTP